MNREALRQVAAYCREHWQAECEYVLHTADEVCKNRFLFDSPLDLERTSETVDFGETIDWFRMENGDREFLFQLNRHRYFIVLGQAYSLTEDEKYAQCFVRLLNDWMEHVPPVYGNGEHPWRELEVGLRGRYWTEAMALFADCPCMDENLRARFENTLKIHADILKKSQYLCNRLSNWGVLQDSGLFAAAAALGDREAMALAAKRLSDEALLQSAPSGMHWEQSCTYHNEVLSCFADVIRLANEQNFSLPEAFLSRTREMARYNLNWLKPNGHQPLFGDSDDNDIRDILSLCAYLFRDENLKFCAYDVLDFENVWRLGPEAVKVYAEIPKTEPRFLNVTQDASGMYALRTSRRADANYLLFHNTFAGGGHAHCDKLHVDLCIGGEDVLTDSGRYSYKDVPKRRLVQNTSGHNVSVMDGKPFMTVQNWMHLKAAPSVREPSFGDDSTPIILLRGGHLGYLQRWGGAYAERKILWIKPDIYVIADTFYTKTRHRCTSRFHFGAQGRAEIASDAVKFTGGTAAAELHFFGEGRRLKMQTALYSPYYNGEQSAAALDVSFGGRGTQTLYTVLYGDKIEKMQSFSVKQVPVFAGDTVLQANDATALTVRRGNDEYTIIFALKEYASPLTANGKIGAGKLSVFLNDEDPIILR